MKAGNEGNGRGVIGKFDGGWLSEGERYTAKRKRERENERERGNEPIKGK